jgi:hypothetical protein
MTRRSHITHSGQPDGGTHAATGACTHSIWVTCHCVMLLALRPLPSCCQHTAYPAAVYITSTLHVARAAVNPAVLGGPHVPAKHCVPQPLQFSGG